jgi:RNA polymerase sigma factor (sigma-70 family)
MKQNRMLAELETLYRANYVRFGRVAAGITGSVESGNDAVHDAFAGCIRALGSYRADGALEAWVWRAVVNSSLKIVRARRSEASFDAGTYFADLPQNGTAVDDPEGAQAIRDAVKSLPEQQRAVLFLRYYADLDYKTIGSVVGVRKGTVGPTLQKAQAAIQRELKEVMSQ